VEYGIQTNLVYGLTPERLQFFREVVGYRGIGTSWDADIRFGSSRPGTAEAELKLWEKNVRTLVAEGHELTLMVSLSRTLLEKFRPAQVIQYAIDLGFRFILFERITADGNAVSGQGVMPSNAMLDSWILQMFDETREHAFHRKIGNMFLDELTQSILSGVHGGNRCRGCEQKLITIRADGSIAGCPNSASTERWGSIHEGPERILSSRGRVDAICTEKQRPMACLSCDLSRICNGDCYKLKWEGDLCAAPKSLMRRMLAETDSEFIRQLRL
jgi:radical SAM protein with 4Fe4S-binding SPASM domain